MQLYINFFSVLVGYDSEHLILDGRFHYEKENQRTLPFNVEIQALPPEKRLVIGSSSEYPLGKKIKDHFKPRQKYPNFPISCDVSIKVEGDYLVRLCATDCL